MITVAEETVEAEVVPFSAISEARLRSYRLDGDRKLTTRREAVQFINEVGIALLFPGDNMPLPDLWSAINGAERKLPKHHHDAALHKTWNWKDEIPTKREAWYGKIVRGKPAFISMDALPAVYALSNNYGELDDYLEAYNDGLLSKEAKDIYEVLLNEGPLSTNKLRKLSGMKGGGDSARRFERAIVELQSDLKIVKSGVSEDNRWKYCYIYDILLRWSPDLREKSREFNSRQATRHLVNLYLGHSKAALPTLFPRLFGWDPGFTDRVISEMLEDGTLERVRVPGGPGLTARAKQAPEGELWVRHAAK
jgi:hypothetical protein